KVALPAELPHHKISGADKIRTCDMYFQPHSRKLQRSIATTKLMKRCSTIELRPRRFGGTAGTRTRTPLYKRCSSIRIRRGVHFTFQGSGCRCDLSFQRSFAALKDRA